MSRKFRTIALSAALLATTTAPALAMCAPGGTNPPPPPTRLSISLSVVLSLFGL